MMVVKILKLAAKVFVHRGFNTSTWKQCYDAMTFNEKDKVNKKRTLE